MKNFIRAFHSALILISICQVQMKQNETDSYRDNTDGKGRKLDLPNVRLGKLRFR
jgi:hypothetical protein